MKLTVKDIASNPDLVEDIEKTALRMITQAIFDYRKQAQEIFRLEIDNPADIAEDITTEAFLDMGVSRIQRRIYGKVDLKKACYIFLPQGTVKVSLYIDSKAEKGADNVARVQMSQLSMTVNQIIGGNQITVPGIIPPILKLDLDEYISVTIFVKYIYEEIGARSLKSIKIISLPNGLLQRKYNPDHQDTIFVVGPNSPKRGEEFRTRLSFKRLIKKSSWRVQHIRPDDSELNWRD